MKHRQQQATLQLMDQQGNPLVNRAVQIKQTNHEMLFGCAGFEVIAHANQEENLEDCLNPFLELFNTATLPFYWGRFEPEQGKPITEKTLKGAKWFKDRGITLKGHPLCWHTVTAPWLMSMSNDEILKTQLARIQRDVTDFSGLIDMWDVINEVVIMPIFREDNGISRICKMLGRVGLVKEVFKAAKEANPNATLLINDFNLSTNYEILIDGCLQAGVPIDAIGLQTHMHKGYRSKEWFNEVLERFSHFGLPLHFTEITLVSGELMPPEIVDLNDFKPDSWPSTPQGEQRQADEAVDLYKMLFSYEMVEAITWWNFTDRAWLGAPAGFLRSDFSKKPSYDALHDLIKKQWWTQTEGVTDQNGVVTFTGYRGDYDIICEGRKAAMKLTKASELEQIRL